MNRYEREALDYKRAINGIYDSVNKTTELSLQAWRERAARTRDALMIIRDGHKQQMSGACEKKSVNS